MRRRIGINLLWLDASVGGAFQYAIDFVRSLLMGDNANDYFVFVNTDEVASKLEGSRGSLIRIDTSRIRSLLFRLRSLSQLTAMLLAIKKLPNRDIKGRSALTARKVLLSNWMKSHYYSATSLRPRLRQSKIDLMVQPHHGWSAYFCGIPYVVAIHDFPAQWSPTLRMTLGDAHVRGAELMQKCVATAAEAVIVDSEISKRQLHESYAVAHDRIHVLPFRPQSSLMPDIDARSVAEVLRKHDLPGRFLFYPAGIHPHKNHIAILEAMAVLRNRDGLEVKAVFTGYPGPAYESLVQSIKELNLASQVFYLGYVSEEDISALYRSAVALVMPTLIGPTNIPVLEAFTMGCPVICSNVQGFKEQIGNAGILIDPESRQELADAITRVWTQPKLREHLTEAGFRRIKETASSNFGNSICAILQKVLQEIPKQRE